MEMSRRSLRGSRYALVLNAISVERMILSLHYRLMNIGERVSVPLPMLSERMRYCVLQRLKVAIFRIVS